MKNSLVLVAGFTYNNKKAHVYFDVSYSTD